MGRSAGLPSEQTEDVEERTGDSNDTGLAGGALRGPGKVARVETERTVLVVTAAGADGVDALGTDTGVRRLTTRLEGSLLPCTQLSEIVPFLCACNRLRTHGVGSCGSLPAPRGRATSHRKNLPSGPSSAPSVEGRYTEGSSKSGERIRTYGRNCSTKHVSNNLLVKSTTHHGTERRGNIRPLGTGSGALVPRVPRDTHLD